MADRIRTEWRPKTDTGPVARGRGRARAREYRKSRIPTLFSRHCFERPVAGIGIPGSAGGMLSSRCAGAMSDEGGMGANLAYLTGICVPGWMCGRWIQGQQVVFTMPWF
ncbi:uncharacterized protein CIMG_03691 [Coccidioides immitis RS]|uniref:Uncharacterized protein n=2 Tax=Coccidioides immitis TaxID=5501 RepID=J3KBX9_COCIM|nr:uncharacterized protein CIMG_03691 [Coccidioides immitis RS]EAS32667.3 hypothetical protein CIMG_03691 [Coccidioides immitis RS]KMP07915.1 hypothetical protein CIRG_07596 [Coccidioides immitis RMSCC 2394]